MPVHGRIYAAVAQMVARRETANPVTFKTHLEDDEAPHTGGAQASRLDREPREDSASDARLDAFCSVHLRFLRLVRLVLMWAKNEPQPPQGEETWLTSQTRFSNGR